MARVVPPNSTVSVGNYSLLPHPDPAFNGLYYFDYLTADDGSDPEGVYAFVIISVEENLRIYQSFTFYKRAETSSGSSATLMNPSTSLLGHMNTGSENLKGHVLKTNQIKSLVFKNQTHGRIKKSSKLEGLITSYQIHKNELSSNQLQVSVGDEDELSK